MKCITVGGATVDIITQVSAHDVERLTMHNTHASFMMVELGRKIETDSIAISVGGGAVNAAVSMNRLGHTVAPIIKVKDDMNGRKIIRLLNDENINTDYVINTAQQSTATSVLLSSVERDPTVFTYRGANTELTADEIPTTTFNGVDLVYITTLSGDSAAALPALAQMAKSGGAFVATNPGILQLQRRGDEILDALSNIDCLTINTREATQLVGKLYERGTTTSARIQAPDGYQHKDSMVALRAGLSHNDGHMNIATFMRTMTALGLGYMVITDGKNGSYMGTPDGVYYAPAQKVKVAGTIGAGDAFASTLTTYLADPDKTDSQALVAGAINSASVVCHTDTHTGLLNQKSMTEKITDAHLQDVIFMPYESQYST